MTESPRLHLRHLTLPGEENPLHLPPLAVGQQVRLACQGAVSAGRRGRHGSLQAGRPVRLGHRGEGGDVAICLGERSVAGDGTIGLDGAWAGAEIIGGVVIESVEVSVGTLLLRRFIF